MEPMLPFLADERVRQLRHDADVLRAGRVRRRLVRRRRLAESSAKMRR